MNIDTHRFTSELNVKLNKGMTGAYFIRCIKCGEIVYTFNCNYPRTALERLSWVENHGWHCPKCWKKGKDINNAKDINDATEQSKET